VGVVFYRVLGVFSRVFNRLSGLATLPVERR
jgi:hypothetical protein